MALDLPVSSVSGVVTKTSRERTYDTRISTPDGRTYTVTILREIKRTTSYPDGEVRTEYLRTPIAASAGEAAAGTDGRQESHYPSADGGFLSKIDLELAQIVALPGYFEAGPGQRSRVYFEDVDDVIVSLLERLVQSTKGQKKTAAIQAAIAALG